MRQSIRWYYIERKSDLRDGARLRMGVPEYSKGKSHAIVTGIQDYDNVASLCGYVAPVGPNISAHWHDEAPHGNRRCKICETVLFDGVPWLVRAMQRGRAIEETIKTLAGGTPRKRKAA